MQKICDTSTMQKCTVLFHAHTGSRHETAPEMAAAKNGKETSIMAEENKQVQVPEVQEPTAQEKQPTDYDAIFQKLDAILDKRSNGIAKSALKDNVAPPRGARIRQYPRCPNGSFYLGFVNPLRFRFFRCGEEASVTFQKPKQERKSLQRQGFALLL